VQTDTTVKDMLADLDKLKASFADAEAKATQAIAKERMTYAAKVAAYESDIARSGAEGDFERQARLQGQLEDLKRQYAEDEAERQSDLTQLQIDNAAKVKEAQAAADKAAEERSGKGLLANMREQLATLTEYRTNLASLRAGVQSASPGLDPFNVDSFIADIANQGPQSYEKVKALLELSPSDLADYVQTWRQVGFNSEQEALSQLESLKAETEKSATSINEMVKTKTQEYVDAWAKANEKIASDAKDAYAKIEKAAKAAIEAIKSLPKAVEQADLKKIGSQIDSATSKSTAAVAGFTINIPISLDGEVVKNMVVKVVADATKAGEYEARLVTG
jgi:hypothetical protein